MDSIDKKDLIWCDICHIEYTSEDEVNYCESCARYICTRCAETHRCGEWFANIIAKCQRRASSFD